MRTAAGIRRWVEERQGKYFCACGCNGLIIIKPSQTRNGVPRFINGHQQKVREYPSAESRFQKMIAKRGASCWIWLGSRYSDGYGRFWVDCQTEYCRAHRFSYELFCGKVPDGMSVLHRCDVPLCVNPIHLFVGSPKDNTIDAVLKGRLARKLTASQVLDGVMRVNNGDTQTAVAKDLGVTLATMNMIMKGVAWKHITGIKPSRKKRCVA